MNNPKQIEKMIVTIMPDAVPGEDFKVEFDENDRPFLVRWNSAKLGPAHSLEEFHSAYMDRVRRKAAVIPGFDTTDPMPWMAEQREMRARKLPERQAEIINGVAFERKN